VSPRQSPAKARDTPEEIITAVIKLLITFRVFIEGKKKYIPSMVVYFFSKKTVFAKIDSLLSHAILTRIFPTHFMTSSQPRSLKANSLGMTESTIMGIAGTAPAYSIEIATSTLIAAVGVFAPASIIVSGIIMFGIALAFMHLNKMSANAGTSYAWVSKIFGKITGFFAGWSLLVLCCIFMVSAMVPAANATLLIFSPELMNNVNWVTGIAAIWLTVISLIVMKGVKLTSYAQIVMTIVEAIILLAIVVMSFVVFTKAPAHPFSWDWFNPFHFTTESFMAGALIAIFFYYGWDVTLNLSEETKDPSRTPGRAAFWSMIFLIFFFVIFMVITLLGLTDAEIQHYNTNVIFAIAEKLFGQTWGYVAIVAVLLSTVGTVETQIIQFTRTLFAKGRDGIVDGRYSALHPKWNTPYIAIGIIWAVGMVLLLGSSYLPSINDILSSSIEAIGIQIAFYLGITGLACAWFYKNLLLEDVSRAITRVIWPAASGIFLFVIGGYSLMEFSAMERIVGLGGILIGAIPLGIHYWKQRRIVSR
jgi:amino acid transporter